ncbi:hypothetical protein HDU83_009897 [Entophlyctis luteolus]|nr:hypothetical protein HDU83_009897 [Entophlyctis luteolus]
MVPPATASSTGTAAASDSTGYANGADQSYSESDDDTLPGATSAADPKPMAPNRSQSLRFDNHRASVEEIPLAQSVPSDWSWSTF